MIALNLSSVFKLSFRLVAIGTKVDHSVNLELPTGELLCPHCPGVQYMGPSERWDLKAVSHQPTW